MSEKAIINEILTRASKLGRRLFRNNTGKAWIGESTHYKHSQFVKVLAGTVVINNARRIDFGIPSEGGSDIIGWTPVLITQEMIGKTLAVFTAIEVKTPNVYASPTQKNFLQAVMKDGGKAGIARSADEGIKVTE